MGSTVRHLLLSRSSPDPDAGMYVRCVIGFALSGARQLFYAPPFPASTASRKSKSTAELAFNGGVLKPGMGGIQTKERATLII
jgi:hypothetical protein